MTATSARPADQSFAAARDRFGRDADLIGSWPKGVELPRYSPWRRIPEYETQGRWLRDRPQVEWPDTLFSITRAPWLLRVLLVVGLILGQVTMVGGVGRHLLAAGLTAALWGWLEWWQTWDITRLGRRLLIIAVQIVLIGAIIVISPVGGIMIWTHYMICGTFFTGAWLLTTVAGSSVLITGVQVGGFVHIPDSWTLAIGLFLFDLFVGIGSITLANRREGAVLRRNETTRRLLIEQKKNAELQDQLMDSAREAGIRDERARLARELHDTVAQGLVAVVTQLEAIAADDLGDSARRRVDNAKALAREGLGEARRAVNALRPPLLDAAALPEAVGRLLNEWSRVNGVAGVVSVSGQPRAFAADHELIRIVQESLSNVARHAGAGLVTISIDYLDDEVLLDIHDDGCGFDVDCAEGPTVSGGRGLPGMVERLRIAGGTLAVESEPGRGCVVSAAVPG